MNTCFKSRGAGAPGDAVRVCRFNFFHEHHVVVYARRPPPKECKLGAQCFCLAERVQSGPFAGKLVHPEHCPAPAQPGEQKKWLRQGKRLVLPQDRVPSAGVELVAGVCDDEKGDCTAEGSSPPSQGDAWMTRLLEVWSFCRREGRLPYVSAEAVAASDPATPPPQPVEAALALWWKQQLEALVAGALPSRRRAALVRELRDACLDYQPHVSRTSKYGALGRVQVLRYHPFVSSSKPVVQVALRCNVDWQCMDRAPMMAPVGPRRRAGLRAGAPVAAAAPPVIPSREELRADLPP